MSTNLRGQLRALRPWWPLCAIALVAVAAWQLLVVDKRSRVIDALLGESLDVEVLNGAFAAKFPDGSTASALQEYFAKVGGSCAAAAFDPKLVHCASVGKGTPACANAVSDGLYCSVVLQGTFCSATWLDVRSRLGADGRVSDVHVTTSFRAC